MLLGLQCLSWPGERSAPITAMRGKKWIKQKAHKETQRALWFSQSTIFTEGTISFQNVGLKISQHLAHEIKRSHRWRVDICSSALPIHVNELTFSFHVTCWGSDETFSLLLGFVFWVDFDWHGLRESLLRAGPGAFSCWRACGSECLLSSDYWTWPEQQL